MTHFDFSKVSTKDFEDIQGMNIFQRAEAFKGYLDYLDNNGFLNYLLKANSGCNSEVELAETKHIKTSSYISFVCNDYLGFTQHPKLKKQLKMRLINLEPVPELLH